MSGGVAAIFAVSTTDSDHLIPWILGFMAVVTVALIIAVVAIAWLDPARLMLGQITGREYVAIRRLTMGDDISGEQVEAVDGPSMPTREDDVIEVTATESRAVPEGLDTEAQGTTE